MLRVIGAGFGRTGALSIKAALEALGFGPCYHMTEVFRHPEHAAMTSNDPSPSSSGTIERRKSGFRPTVCWCTT